MRREIIDELGELREYLREFYPPMRPGHFRRFLPADQDMILKFWERAKKYHFGPNEVEGTLGLAQGQLKNWTDARKPPVEPKPTEAKQLQLIPALPADARLLTLQQVVDLADAIRPMLGV